MNQAELILAKRERLRRERVNAAIAQFKEHRKFPAAVVQIEDKNTELQKIKPDAPRLSESLIEYAVKYLDIHGEAYLQLVDSQSLQEHFEAVMDDLTRMAWFNASGLPMEAIPPAMPFATPRPEQLQLKRLQERTRHWKTEGYRRLAQRVAGDTKPVRKGYRNEITAWMRKSEISSQVFAAKRLNVSIDVLKSIMSDKGRPRYSHDTLQDVLGKIGYSEGK